MEAEHEDALPPRRPEDGGEEGGDARRRVLQAAAASVVATAFATLVSAVLFQRLSHANPVMVYLLGVVLTARLFGFAAAALASLLSVLAFDFFFVPPIFSLLATSAEDIMTLAIMLVVALVVSNVTSDLRSQAESARHRERRTSVLYAFTGALAGAQSVEDIVHVAVQHVSDEFHGETAVLLAADAGRVAETPAAGPGKPFENADLRVAQWVFNNGAVAGHGTETLRDTEGVYFPIDCPSGRIGVLALKPASLRRIFLPDQRRLIDAFIGLIAQAIERVRLVKEAQEATVRAKTESLRNSLLSAIAHDFRTPLGSIVAASSGLLDRRARLTEEESRELSETVYEEAQRMTRLANNILQMARLEAGVVTLNREWYPVDEIVGGVLTRLSARIAAHAIGTDLPQRMLMVNVDAVMIEQVLENLIENAVKYTPKGTAIEVGAAAGEREVLFWVADRGPGIPVADPETLFEKFHRGTAEGPQNGTGLGLTICRAIVEAHGGRIGAANRPAGGAIFRFALPATEQPPQLLPEDEQPVGAA
jgi:two-component system sensor histidine kinase KdpD